MFNLDIVFAVEESRFHHLGRRHFGLLLARIERRKWRKERGREESGEKEGFSERKVVLKKSPRREEIDCGDERESSSFT